jgi:hypothetical protein
VPKVKRVQSAGLLADSVLKRDVNTVRLKDLYTIGKKLGQGQPGRGPGRGGRGQRPLGGGGVLRVHAARGAGVPLHDLRPGALAGLGRRRGVLASPRPGAANPAVGGGAPRGRGGAVAVRPAEQARAAVEPVDPAGPGCGAGRGPALLLRAFRRPRRAPLPVHGRRFRRRRHRAPDLRRRGSPGPRAPPVPPRLRLTRVARRRVRQARVGRARHRRALRTLHQGTLVRPLRHPAHPAGQMLMSIHLSPTNSIYQFYHGFFFSNKHS